MRTPVEDSVTSSKTEYVRPARVTFVIPGPGRAGGIRVTVEMAKRLRNAGYSVRIVYRQFNVSPLDRAKAGLRLLYDQFRSLESTDWLTDFPGCVETARSLNELEFVPGEVVIAVGSGTVEYVAALDDPRIIKVRYCHGLQRYDSDLMRRAWGQPMHTLAVSGSLVPDLQAYGHEERIWVVANGIDRSDYYREDLPRDGLGTIYGRNYAKNPEHILEVMNQLGKRHRDIRRYVFGAHHRPRGIPRKCYWSFPSVAQARGLYNRAKIWLLLSRTEGFPGPILEAMACGCAVVSTEHDGSRELIQDGVNGLRIPVGNTAKCLDAIEQLWEDGPFRERLVEAGFETVKRYSWDNAVAAMQRALDEIIEGVVAD